jgi:hypothetical protein
MNKRGQIAIFIIVGLLLVVGITLVFTIYRQPDATSTQELNPESFIDDCVREGVRNTVNLMLPQGGFVNPGDYKVYDSDNVAYLCKNVNYYEPCIFQHPAYITRLQEEIESSISGAVQQCFITLENELQDRNYDVSGGDVSLDVELKPDAIEVNVFRQFSLSKDGTQRSYNSFLTTISSPLYDLADVANKIASEEAKYCYFEHTGYSILYPQFDIRMFTMSDSTKIYTITDISSGEEMKFAIRGCAIPAGF